MVNQEGALKMSGVVCGVGRGMFLFCFTTGLEPSMFALRPLNEKNGVSMPNDGRRVTGTLAEILTGVFFTKRNYSTKGVFFAIGGPFTPLELETQSMCSVFSTNGRLKS